MTASCKVFLKKLHAKDITDTFCKYYGLNHESANECKAALLQWRSFDKGHYFPPVLCAQQQSRECYNEDRLCRNHPNISGMIIKMENSDGIEINQECFFEKNPMITKDASQDVSVISTPKTEQVEHPVEKIYIKEESIKVDSIHEEKMQESSVPLIIKTEQAQAEHSVGSSTDAATARAAGLLEEGGHWTVDPSNWRAAILALADRQPALLILRAASHGVPETLKADIVAAIAGAARDCVVRMDFWDTFYSPDDQNTDRQRLEYVLANTSLYLTEFYGHLDAAGISRLPHSYESLGLAIASAEDAVAVSSMDVWAGLWLLDVAVSTSVAPRDLRPLSHGIGLSVHFYGISDGQVDLIRPAVDALWTEEGLFCLYLPKCQLSANGARRLAHQLRGARIITVYIDPRGLWRPEEEKRRSVTEAFRSAVRCDVVWRMEHLYEEQ